MQPSRDEELRWYHYAACQGIDLNFFFDEYENDPVVANVVDSICANCPVRQLCYEEGVDKNETGVWGGVYLTNGKKDANRNQHKTESIWELMHES